MKKVVRLTESDLVRLVKKVISEQNRSLVGMSGFVSEQSNDNEMFGKKLANLYSKNKMEAKQWFKINKNTAIVDAIERSIKMNDFKSLGDVYSKNNIAKRFVKEMSK
jgi:hypothetical protein